MFGSRTTTIRRHQTATPSYPRVLARRTPATFLFVVPLTAFFSTFLDRVLILELGATTAFDSSGISFGSTWRNRSSASSNDKSKPKTRLGLRPITSSKEFRRINLIATQSTTRSLPSGFETVCDD